MAWTYSQNPGSDDKDATRFFLGDTSSAAPELQDEEILFLLSVEGNDPLRAAARGAETLAAKYSALVDKSIGGASISLSQRADHFYKLSKNLMARASSRTSTPYAGGLTDSDKLVNTRDQDTVQPFFSRDMMDYPYTSTPQVVDPRHSGEY